MNKSQARQLQRRLVGVVTDHLRSVIHDPRVVVHSGKRTTPWETDTGGYASSIARVKGDGRNEFQLWIDRYLHPSKFTCSACYYSHQPTRIRQLVEVDRALGRPIRTLTDADVRQPNSTAYKRLAEGLAGKLYGRPIAELYAHGGFYGVYFEDVTIAGNVDLDRLAAEIEAFLMPVIRSVAAGPGSTLSKSDDYPTLKNRSYITRHKARERSGRLATLAKQRDGFTCRVCHINYADLYGELGSGYAEAHHLMPLSSPRARKETVVDDLVTVCANCHRMLHRMHGKEDDLNELRRQFTARWPTSNC